ncbi:hypothetical protein H0X48_02190 [Candidatus Dependentiae bacterium]|nr:hypothetical protein [Candidatus Dependentiae bacterium]
MNSTTLIRALLLSLTLIGIHDPYLYSMMKNVLPQTAKTPAYDTFRKRTAYLKAYSLFKESQKYDFSSNKITEPQELKRHAAKNEELDTVKKTVTTLLEGFDELLVLFGADNTVNRDAFLLSLAKVNLEELVADKNHPLATNVAKNNTILEQINAKIHARNRALAQEISMHIQKEWPKELAAHFSTSEYFLKLVKCIEDAYNTFSDTENILAHIQKSLLTDMYKIYANDITNSTGILSSIPKIDISAGKNNLSAFQIEELKACLPGPIEAHKKKIEQLVTLLNTKAVSDLTEIKTFIKEKKFQEAFAAVNSLKSPALDDDNQLYKEVEIALKSLPEEIRKKLPNGQDWIYRLDSTSAQFALLKETLEELSALYTSLTQRELKSIIENYISNNTLEKTQLNNRLAYEISKQLEHHLPGSIHNREAHNALQKIAQALTTCCTYDKNQEALTAIARSSISDQPLLFHEDTTKTISTRTLRELILAQERTPTDFMPHFICYFIQTTELKEGPQDIFNFLIALLDYYPSVSKDPATGQPVYYFIKSAKVCPKNKRLLLYIQTLLDNYKAVINRQALADKWELNLEHITQLEQPTKISGIHEFSSENAPTNKVEKSWNFKNIDDSITTVTLMIDKDTLLYCPRNTAISLGTLKHVSTSNSSTTSTNTTPSTLLDAKCSTLFPPAFAQETVLLTCIAEALHSIKVQQLALNNTPNEQITKSVGVCKNGKDKIFIEFIIDKGDSRVVPSIVTLYPLANFKQANPILVKDINAFKTYTHQLGIKGINLLQKNAPLTYRRIMLDLMGPEEISYQNKLKALICNDVARQLIVSSQLHNACVTPESLKTLSPLANKDILVLIFGAESSHIEAMHSAYEHARAQPDHKEDKPQFKKQLTQIIDNSGASSYQWVNDALALGNGKKWSSVQLKNSVLYCYTALSNASNLNYLLTTKQNFKDKTNVLVVVCSFQTGAGNALRISDKLKQLPNGDKYSLGKIGSSFFYIPIKKHEIDFCIQQQLTKTTSTIH